MIIHLIVGLIKKILLCKISYFPEPYDHSKNEEKVVLNLSNHATKSDLKSATGVDTSKSTKEVYLASSKSKVDKLDIDKTEATLVDLNKLSDEVKIEVVKKTEYNELVKRVNAIQTAGNSNLVKISGYNTKIGEIEKKNT